jgi:hypothetical protein
MKACLGRKGFHRSTNIISLNTPATDFELRYEHDSALYFWSQAQEKAVLGAGHTHRPVFKSQSQEEIVRKALKEAEEQLINPQDDLKLQQQTAELSAQLEWIRARKQQSSQLLPLIELKKLSYFNTGCCAFSEGDITGLELSDGEIRLVRWPNDEDLPKPKVLVMENLKDVFAVC